MDTEGRSFAEISRDLEMLKVALIGMTPDDMAPVDAESVAREISAIRLQLKRLEADRTAAIRRYDAAHPDDA
jgi:hypothetical protein